MAAGGFKTFIAGETLDEDEINDFLMQGVLVFAGTAARGSAIGTAVEGQFAYLKDSDKLTFFDGSQWADYDAGYIQATVASTTGSPATGQFTDGNGLTWDYYDFTGNGSITISAAGYADCLVVGGGGGGRSQTDTAPTVVNQGGGGAGLVQYGLVYLSATTHTITIGTGGTGNNVYGGSAQAGNGVDTTLGSVVRAGGGNGGIAFSDFLTGANITPSSGHSGGISVSDSTSQNNAGAGALGNPNAYTGVSLNYNGSTIEYGVGGYSASVTANTGSGGLWTGGNGAAGRVIVKVLA